MTISHHTTRFNLFFKIKHFVMETIRFLEFHLDLYIEVLLFEWS